MPTQGLCRDESIHQLAGNAYCWCWRQALVFDQVIDGKHYYFDEQGKKQVKDVILDYNGKRYFDETLGTSN